MFVISCNTSSSPQKPGKLFYICSVSKIINFLSVSLIEFVCISHHCIICESLCSLVFTFVCICQAEMLLSESQTAELLSFLSPSARPDVKGQATGFLLGLSGDRYEADRSYEHHSVISIVYLDLKSPWYLCLCVFRDGCQVLGSKPELLAALFALTSDLSIAVAKDCYFILVNLSADKTLHQVMGPEQRCTPTA